MARKWNLLDADYIVKKYISGISEKALSIELNATRGMIRRVLITSGITPRNRSAAMYQRMANATPKERSKLAEKAHDAVRGKKRSSEELIKRAISKQELMTYLGKGEEQLKNWIIERGEKVVPQLAFDRYNIDLAVGPVAVELLIGSINPLVRGDAKKIEYLCRHGWSVLYVWLSCRGYPTEAHADYIVSYVNEVRRDPTLIGEYRMIRRDAKLAAQCCFDFD
jgi:hypothetical protein